MKRASKLIEQIYDFDNLILAAYKAFKGKAGSEEVIEFRKDFYCQIKKIQDSIKNNEISFGKYHEFVIFEPKKRLICAAPIKQRIVHHAIMNVCHKYFERNLIYDSYASRPGKGVHKAVLRTQKLIQSCRFYAKLDFRKYFDNISHNILSGQLKRMFKDRELLNLFDKIIKSYGKDDKGLPIGNLTSQYFANFYLSELDHYMKEVVKCNAYIRYMDDVIILSPTLEELKQFSNCYCRYAMTNLSLTVKPPIIGKICKGVPFLGYKVFKDKIMIGGKAKRRFKRNLNMLNRLYSKNKISEFEYSSRLGSIISFVRFADSFKFRKNWLNVKELQSRESWW